MIERALGVPVVQHDDGSRSGMHDLDIVFPDGQYGAVEATAAADAASIELWNLMNGGGRWIEDSLAGGWMVSVHPHARACRLRQELPHLLGRLERLGVAELRTRRRGDGLEDVARDLGIANAGQSATGFPGSIYITLQLPTERMGGFAADTGDALAEWLGEFLVQPGQHDVLAKLANSGADERHALVFFPGFTTAPFSVSDLLMRSDAPLPLVSPVLPAEVSHVWAVSLWASGDGMRWSAEGGWARFTKLQTNRSHRLA